MQSWTVGRGARVACTQPAAHAVEELGESRTSHETPCACDTRPLARSAGDGIDRASPKRGGGRRRRRPNFSAISPDPSEQKFLFLQGIASSPLVRALLLLYVKSLAVLQPNMCTTLPCCAFVACSVSGWPNALCARVFNPSKVSDSACATVLAFLLCKLIS